MKMVDVKTAELIGPALDWAVAKAVGWTVEVTPHGQYSNASTGHKLKGRSYRLWMISDVEPEECMPSIDWSQGGPLIDKHHIQTSYNGNYFSQSPTREYWCAYVCKPSGQEERPSGGGPTALIALCRAIVAAHSGDVVSVPAELMGPPK